MRSLRLFGLVLVALLVAGCGSDPETSNDMSTSDTTTDTGADVPTDTDATDSINPFGDSDNDGLDDYIEDANGNGIVDPGETDPANPDTDNDGLADGQEDANHNGFFDPGETDPTNEDTDGDTIWDGIEDANGNGVHDADDGETDPLSADSDGDGLDDAIEVESSLGLDPNSADTDEDGLPDGVEDINGNGEYDPDLGETDPTAPDTDMDGLSDGCEDTNANGMVDDGETDPRVPDSDSDGLIDGDECQNLPAGACPNFDNAGNCSTNPTLADTDGDGLSDLIEVNSDYGGGISSDPRNPDTDGDGVPDGLEDFNQNGRYDPALGELNPIDPMTDGSTPDGERPQAQACLSTELPPVIESMGGDFKLAYNDGFDAVELGFGGSVYGHALDHRTLPVHGFIINKSPASSASNALEQEAIDAMTIGGTSSFPRAFTTWDGFDGRITTYEITGSDTGIGKRNSLISGLTGVGSIMNLPASGGASATNWRLTVLTVYRSSSEVVLVGALIPNDTPASDATEVRALSLTNGTGLAQLEDDFTYTQSGDPLKACNIFRVNELPIVDFLFIIDDTGSMGPYQTQLITATNEIFDAIRSSFISARWTTASTEVAEIENAYATHCGLTQGARGVGGSIWSPFTSEYEDDFQCKVRDPIGNQNCDPAGNDFPGGNEYGLLCSMWSIDYFQGRRGTFNAADLQRPRSELIVVIVTDECEAVECTNGGSMSTAAAAETLAFLGVTSWSQVTRQNAADAFITFYKTVAAQPPYGAATPFLLYSKDNTQNTRDNAVYKEFLEDDSTIFPNGASMDIRNQSEIPTFVQKIIRSANGLASEFTPSHVPVTANMNCVVQRAFSTDSVVLLHSLENGWNYDPTGNSMVFYGADRPRLLDSFAINYAYWVEPATP